MRVEFTFRTRARTIAGIRTFEAFSEPSELSYYNPTYAYRLRWNEVAYEPGELKAVAYKKGREIGSADRPHRGTAGRIAAHARSSRTSRNRRGSVLRPRRSLRQGWHSLSACEQSWFSFKVDGPGEIVGVGNGNPLSLEPFQAGYRKLFFGKAMLIVRTIEGQHR